MTDNTERTDTAWTKAKCGLLLSLMKERFEVHMYEMLGNGYYSSPEELDSVLDTELRRYFAERDAVKRYYEQKLLS